MENKFVVQGRRHRKSGYGTGRADAEFKKEKKYGNENRQWSGAYLSV